MQGEGNQEAASAPKDHAKEDSAQSAAYETLFIDRLVRLASTGDLMVTLAGYYIHSTLVPVIVPKCFFPPSEEIDVKDSFLSNGRGRVG
jgi:hypothetical protein